MQVVNKSGWAGTMRQAVLLGLIGFWLFGPASAPARADGRQDHEIARQALAAGEILPLRTVLEKIQREHRGEVLEVELERESGRWIYEVKMLRADGGINKLLIDARNAALLEVKGRRHGRRSQPEMER